MKKYLVVFLIAFGFVACENKESSNKIIEDKYPQIIQAYNLDFGDNFISLQNIINLDKGVDSVKLNGELINIEENNSVKILNDNIILPLNVLSIYQKEMNSIDILLKKSNKINYEFTFNPNGKNYKKVQLKGEMNAWNPLSTELEFVDGLWRAEFVLDNKSYQYLMVLDGVETLDENNDVKVSNGMGGFNSVLKVSEENRFPKPIIFTHNFNDKEIELTFDKGLKKALVFYNNILIEELEITKWPEEESFLIPEIAINHKRSFIRVYGYNDNQISNEVLIPLEYGKVISNPEKLLRQDMHSAIMYNVFVDRFYNGNPENDLHLNDNIVLGLANYQGGDIKGISDKINDGYFKELGVNTLWLSPIVRNTHDAYGYWPEPESKFSAYHGYWPLSFVQIDEHFGDSAQFKNFVDLAHQNDYNVMVDYVANHIHQDYGLYKEKPEIATKLELPDGTLNLERWDEYRLTTWFDKFLPSLDLEQKWIRDFVSDSALYWIDVYGIDGFRFDAAKHVPLDFWKELTTKIIHESDNPNAFQLGETYGSPELIGSYLSHDRLDAQFDFNVYDAAVNVFAANSSFKSLIQRLYESLNQYGAHNLMGYISGNQDRARFISYASGDLELGEDTKLAGWTRDIGVKDTIAYKKLQMLMAFNFAIPGIPVIYYGDEFGMPGGNDPDSRRMMRFGDELNKFEKKNLEVSKKLTELRNSNMALIYGDIIDVRGNDVQLAIIRKHFDNYVIVVFNNSEESILFDLPITYANTKKSPTSAFGNSISEVIDNSHLRVELDPYSFDYIIFLKYK